MITVILFIFALVAASLIVLINKYKTAREIIKAYLLAVIFFNIGVMGLLAAYSHTYMAEETALKIGWLPGSPFQAEIASANLAIGILGVLSPLLKAQFWLATVIGSSVFLLGDAAVHYNEWLKGNDAPYNAGILVWFGDVAMPIIALALIAAYYMTAPNRPYR